MAKGQKRSNREAKKPKKETPKVYATASREKGPVTLGERKKER